MTIRPRSAIDAIAAYVPGRAAPPVPGALKLASNENPLGPSPKALAAIAAALPELHRYPDSSGGALKDAIAARHGLAAGHVLVGNGSDDVIYLLATVYLEPGRSVVLADPPYSIHRIAAQVAGAEIVRVPLVDGVHDLPAMAAAARPDGWVAVTNPHNPTGTAVDPGALRELVAAVPGDCLVLVDEAYHDFMDAPVQFSAASLLHDHRNVVVLRTFSKAFGLAGLRVGYALGDPSLLEPVERIRPPFNVGVAAQAGALAALGDKDHLARTVASNAEARALFLDACVRAGLEALSSQANFVLVRDRDGWPDALAAAGITVRPGGNLGAPGWHRVTLGTPEQMRRVVALMEAAVRR